MEQILVVEDEREMAEFLKVRLESAGYQVRLEYTGRAALRYATQSPPKLVILDLKLPDLQGLEVCRKLRILYRPWVLPILVLTVLSKLADERHSFSVGADAYMTKPFAALELLKMVALLLRRTNP